MFFKKKVVKQEEKKPVVSFRLLKELFSNYSRETATGVTNASEPITLATIRLEGGANDKGALKGRRAYNAHKAKLNNQWVNPLNSINSGFGTAQLAYFNYQVVNFWECYALAQDPMFTRIFALLSETPFAKTGEIVGDFNEEERKAIGESLKRWDFWKTFKSAVRAEYVAGGCLMYMDFGDKYPLDEPFSLRNADLKEFKGFRQIDPINVAAVEVNTIQPASPDYMKPTVWYVVGLGNVHASHFLQFEANAPELVMRPLCMYFGTPLTQLIKQDIANSNMVTQGVAGMIGRFRYNYLKTPQNNFTTGNAANFAERLKFMSFAQDNFMFCPIADNEEVQQLVSPLSGLAENVELFFQVLAAKTSITKSVLLSQGSSGLSGTLEGERANWYDACHNIQEANKENLLTMLGVVCGTNTGKFVEFSDFEFAPLEEASEREMVENLRTYAEITKAMVELGADQEQALQWLTRQKGMNLQIDFDDNVVGLESYEEEVKTENAFITIHPNGKENKGQPLWIEEGETPKEAMERKFGKSLGEEKGVPKEDNPPAPPESKKKELTKDDFVKKKFTKKAVLFEKDGVEFWVKKSSIREDGTLTSGALKEYEAAKKGEGWLDKKKEERAERQEFYKHLETSGISVGSPSWEGEKAIGLDVNIDFYDIEQNDRVRIFVPKSQIKDGKIPYWLFKAKIKDLEEDLKDNRSRTGGYVYETPFHTSYEGKKLNYTSEDWEEDKGARAQTGNSVYMFNSGELVEFDESLVCEV